MGNKNELDNQLKAKYRTEVYETDDVNLEQIDDISDEELKTIIQLNNRDLSILLNEKPLDKELMTKLLVANLNFYLLAKKREISVHGSSFLMTIATAIGYNLDKVCSKLSVGLYTRVVDPEKLAKSGKTR